MSQDGASGSGSGSGSGSVRWRQEQASRAGPHRDARTAVRRREGRLRGSLHGLHQFPARRQRDHERQRLVIEVRVKTRADDIVGVGAVRRGDTRDRRRIALRRVLVHGDMIRHPEIVPVAHALDIVEERQKLRLLHRPEILPGAPRRQILDAVEDDVFVRGRRNGPLGHRPHRRAVGQVIDRAVPRERRTADEILAVADLLFHRGGHPLSVDMPVVHAGLRVRDEPRILSGHLREQIVGAVPELRKRPFVGRETAMVHRVMAGHEFGIVGERLDPLGLAGGVFPFRRHDIERRAESALLQFRHRHVERARPAVVEHERERTRRAVRPPGHARRSRRFAASCRLRRKQRQRPSRRQARDAHNNTQSRFHASNLVFHERAHILSPRETRAQGQVG